MRFDNLKIVDDDDGTTMCERGLVQTNGDSAAIYDWDPKQGRYVQKDRLTEAKLGKTTKNSTILTGTSHQLLNEVGVVREQAVLNLKLMHDAGKPLDYG